MNTIPAGTYLYYNKGIAPVCIRLVEDYPSPCRTSIVCTYFDDALRQQFRGYINEDHRPHLRVIDEGELVMLKLEGKVKF